MIGRDARGDGEQYSCSPSQAEEEVPQPVHPQDQQHRAGPVRPAERDAGVTGDNSHHDNTTAKEGGEEPPQGQTGHVNKGRKWKLARFQRLFNWSVVNV